MPNGTTTERVDGGSGPPNKNGGTPRCSLWLGFLRTCEQDSPESHISSRNPSPQGRSRVKRPDLVGQHRMGNLRPNPNCWPNEVPSEHAQNRPNSEYNAMRMGMRPLYATHEWVQQEAGNLPRGVALYFMHHNFCRVHKSLRVTPAMEAGPTDHVWDIEELIALPNMKL